MLTTVYIQCIYLYIQLVHGGIDMLLEVKNVSKHLGAFHLDNISLELPEGYIMGLVGPNGAGKTTLLHLILGLYQPGQGEILIDGMSYQDNEREIREQIGVVLLERMFDTGMTLQENGDYYGKYYKNYDVQTLEAYLKRFGLELHRKYKALSKGEELKFQLAFALSHAPKLLILDEPAGSFDPEFRVEFFEVLKEFIADGSKSVIISTHLTEDLERMADYITYLEKGKCLLSTDIESMREGYRLVIGETYKIKLIPQENIIHMEEGTYGTKALVIHRKRYSYDRELTVTTPTIEELMYFMTKRGRKKR